MHYIGHRTSETNPLRSLPLFVPATRMFGPSPLFVAQTLLRQAERALPVYRADLLAAHTKLSRANRCDAPAYRRVLQRDAMRAINMARRVLRGAYANLANCRDNLAALTEQPELPLVPPVPASELTGRRVLREQVGTFPVGTVVTVEPGVRSGYGARIVRPDGTGTATHLPTEDAALAWVDAQLAAPTLH